MLFCLAYDILIYLTFLPMKIPLELNQSTHANWIGGMLVFNTRSNGCIPLSLV